MDVLFFLLKLIASSITSLGVSNHIFNKGLIAE